MPDFTHFLTRPRQPVIRNGYEVTVINPIQTEAHRRGKIRRTKSDKRDSIIIADLLCTKVINPSYVLGRWIQELRELTRFCFGLIESSGDLKRQMLSVLDKVFPEFETIFSDVFIKSARTLLKEKATPFVSTILGIGKVLAATIIAEIGDINRFESQEKLAAFAGIDPTVYRTGKFTNDKMVMPK